MAGYSLRVHIDKLDPKDVPLTDEQGQAMASFLKLAETDETLWVFFENQLAKVWTEHAQKMVAEGTLPFVPSLDEHDVEFELIVPDAVAQTGQGG